MKKTRRKDRAIARDASLRARGSLLVVALCAAFAAAWTLSAAAPGESFENGRAAFERKPGRDLPCLRKVAGWTSGTQMPTGRSGAGVGVIDGKLYVVGGYLSGQLTTLESYDPVSDEWMVETPLPAQAAMGVPVVEVVDGKLYTLGGYPTNEEVWEFDPATSEWTFEGYAGFGSTITNSTTVSGVIDGWIFVVDPDWGGWMVRAYEPTTRSIREVHPGRGVRKRGGTAGGIIDGKIFVAGGVRFDWQMFPEPSDPPELVADVDVYDIVTDTWSTAAPMPQPLAYAESAVMDGKLYVVGGITGDYAAQDLELVQAMHVYDPTTDSWTVQSELPTPRRGHGVAAIDGRLFVVGGKDTMLDAPPVATLDIFSQACRPGRDDPGPGAAHWPQFSISTGPSSDDGFRQRFGAR